MKRFAVLAAAAIAFGQTAAQLPRFDAASIRLNQTSDRPSTHYDASRVDLHKASMKHLVRRGWPVPDYQIVWPSWVDDRPYTYDVSVTFPSATTPAQLEQMFQDMMATRFGMQMHWETRDTKVWELTASPKGLKLQTAKNPAPPTDYPKFSTTARNGEWLLSSKLGEAPSGLTVKEFAEVITNTRILDRPLVDATGTDGYFDVEITAHIDPPENKPNPAELLSALEKQLGLKVTQKTIPMKILVVDRLERTPTNN